MSEPRFIALGMGRYVRADRVIAVIPVEGDERGPGRRTLILVDGRDEPIVASRGEQGIVADLSAGPIPIASESNGDDEADPPAEVERPPSLF